MVRFELAARIEPSPPPLIDFLATPVPRCYDLWNVVHSMSMNPDSRFRIRFTLFAVILATLPCYCAGLVMVRLAQRPAAIPTTEPAPTQSEAVVLPSDTPAPVLPSPTNPPTAEPAATVTVTPTPSPEPTWTETPTLEPTETLEPPTNTALPPTETPTPTEEPAPDPTDPPSVETPIPLETILPPPL